MKLSILKKPTIVLKSKIHSKNICNYLNMAVIDQLFSGMIQRGASDLHLQEGQPAKARVHGDIESIMENILGPEEISSLLSEVAGPEKWRVFQERGDLDFAYQMDEYSRFRCNYMRHVHGIGAVFRLIPTKILTLEELGVPTVIRSFGRMRAG